MRTRSQLGGGVLGTFPLGANIISGVQLFSTLQINFDTVADHLTSRTYASLLEITFRAQVTQVQTLIASTLDLTFNQVPATILETVFLHSTGQVVTFSSVAGLFVVPKPISGTESIAVGTQSRLQGIVGRPDLTVRNTIGTVPVH